MARRRSNVSNKDSSTPVTTKQSGRKVQGQKNNNSSNEWTLSYKYIFLVSLTLVCVVNFYPNGLRDLVDYTANVIRGAQDHSQTEDRSGTEPSSTTKTEQPRGPDQTTPNDIVKEAKDHKSQWQKSFSVKKIFADGRRIPPVQLLPQKETNSSVKLYIFDDFLSVTECNGLMKAHDRHVKDMNDPPLLCFDSLDTLKSHLRETGMKMKVTSKVFAPGTLCLNSSLSTQIQTQLNSNWSYSTAFYPEESKFSTIVGHRIKEAMGLIPEAGGKFQITSYPVGKAYKTHTDCVIDGRDQRDRVASVIMYLNDVEDGGETKFPDLGISVTPKKGRALVWNNMSPEGSCEPHSRHLASVVKSGSKYILMRWYYYKTFYSLGKRMPGPGLPERSHKVPLVMCDFYTHGSCRWYDEWTPQVMTEYALNEHSFA